MTRSEVLRTLYSEKLVAILRGIPVDRTVAAVQALVDGGVRMVEIAIDHASQEDRAASLASISLAAEHFGDKIVVGAGTALTEGDVVDAVATGADFILSPNFNENVVRQTRSLNRVSIPAAMTPTELVSAHACGGDVIKLFPAGELGPAYVRSILAPLPDLPVLAVGGISRENIESFLKLGIVGVGVGTALVSARQVWDGEFHQITETALQMVSLSHSIGAESREKDYSRKAEDRGGENSAF